MTTPNSGRTDDVSVGLALALAAAALIALMSLGPVAILSAVIPWLVSWATGRSSDALPFFLIGFTVVAGLIALGHLGPALAMGYAAISAPSDNMAMTWTLLAIRTDLAPSALAVGVSVGSLARMLVQDKRNEALGGTDKEPEAPPLARLRAKLSGSKSAAHGNGTILGTDAVTGETAMLPDHDANHHVIVVGATGTGKTVTGTNIIQSHIERGHPVIFLDGKGDIGLGRRLKALAEELGRPAYIFHHEFGGGKIDDACAYNPVSADDFTALANLITTLRPFTEPHYEVLQKGFMQAATKVAKAIGEPVDLLTLGNLLSVHAMTAAIRKNKHRIEDAQALLTEIQEQRKAEEAGVESLTGIIKNLARSSMAPLFNTGSGRPVLTLPGARENGAFVYFALPALVYPDLSRGLGQLVINDIRLTLASGHGPWLIVLDEISTYSGEQILSLINQGRGFDARVVLLGQSFADLETVDHVDGKAFRNQVLASVNTVIVHRVNSPDDAELASQIAGTYAKPELTAQTLGNQPTGAGSVRITREFNVGPDRFKKLKRGEAIVLSKFGQQVRKIKARLPEFMR